MNHRDPSAPQQSRELINLREATDPPNDASLLILRFMAAARRDVSLAPSIQLLAGGLPRCFFTIISHRDGILHPCREQSGAARCSPSWPVTEQNAYGLLHASQKTYSIPKSRPL